MAASTLASATGDLNRALRLNHVWFFQAYHAISAKYRRSVLGPFWLAGSMVATSLALAVVFGGLFGQSLRETLPFIMAGILSWSLVSMPIGEGPETFVGFAGIIKNNNFPFMYYVFELVCRNLIILMHNVLVYFVVILLVGGYHGFHWSILFSLPLITINVILYCPLIGMFAARYRDIRFLFPYLGQMLFFMTPIFWDAKGLHGARALIAAYNPLYHLIQVMRQPLLGAAASAVDWGASVLVALVGLALWVFFFRSYRHRIPFWV